MSVRFSTTSVVGTVRSSACLLLAAGFLLAACRPAEIDASRLAELEGRFVDRGSGKPFTGEVTGSVQGRLEDGLWEGTVTTFRADGQRNSEAEFKSGAMHGVTRTWYDGGRLASEATYRDDALNGTQRTWFDNGQLASEKHFSQGRAQGEETRYSRNGARLLLQGWLDGQLHGFEVHYCGVPRTPGADPGRCSAWAEGDIAPVVLAVGGELKVWCHDQGRAIDTARCAAAVARDGRF